MAGLPQSYTRQSLDGFSALDKGRFDRGAVTAHISALRGLVPRLEPVNDGSGELPALEQAQVDINH